MNSKELYDKLKEKGYKIGYEHGTLIIYLNEKDWKNREKVRKFVEKELAYKGSWGMKLKKERTENENK